MSLDAKGEDVTGNFAANSGQAKECNIKQQKTTSKSHAGINEIAGTKRLICPAWQWLHARHIGIPPYFARSFDVSHTTPDRTTRHFVVFCDLTCFARKPRHGR
ncbi:hypothetical protein [Paraburkholderia caffeinitolerans]|uniref:hypothetical protein n=1 Tax=Paraburkholderia caffeinitolerans TaxID=1723730 RepID=UPI00158289AD|nr:hypothetical protein [Paraburkholderia caffeinitolerans]